MHRRFASVVVIGIFFLIQSLSAQTWQKTKRLTWNSNESRYPNVTTGSNNTIHVVWQNGIPTNYEIYYKKSTNGGSNWMTTKRLTWNSSYSQWPTIATDSNNNIHIVWQDGIPINYEIYYKKSTNGGATWTTSRRLTWSSNYSQKPAIAIDSGDNIHVVWHDTTLGNYEIYYKKSTNGGATWTVTQRLTWSTGLSGSPTIVIDSTDNVHLVWHDDSPGWPNLEIYYKKSTDEGATWTTTQRLTWSLGSSLDPTTGIDSSGNIHVLWSDSTPGNYEIYHKKSTNGGSNWIATQRLTWNSGQSSSPAIAVDSNGKIHIVWEDNTFSNYEILFKGSTDGGANWETTQRLLWNSGQSWRPTIATDINDNIHVIWYDNTPGNYEIYYKKGIQ